MADANVQAWLELESSWYPQKGNFVGCGYVGTSDNIKAVKFGGGCTGCEDEEEAYPSNLLWLWITLGVVGTLLIGLGVFLYMKQSKV
jgi:hypothetical protein